MCVVIKSIINNVSANISPHTQSQQVVLQQNVRDISIMGTTNQLSFINTEANVTH